MRIGVISDTHIPKTGEWLPKRLCEELKNVDLILHAGDFTEMEVLERLKEFAPIRAVYGNMDDIKVQRSLPRKDIIEVAGSKIGLTHGFGPPLGLMERVENEFKNANVNAIIFGHSHSPKNEVKDGILLFNPGSPTDKIFARFNSYGILEVNQGIKGEIIKL